MSERMWAHIAGDGTVTTYDTRHDAEEAARDDEIGSVALIALWEAAGAPQDDERRTIDHL